MLELNAVNIFKVIDSIINNTSSFINTLQDDIVERENKNIEMIEKLSKSLLPALKNEFGVNQEVLSDSVISKVIEDGLKTIDGNIREIVFGNDQVEEKINSLLIQVNNVFSVRRDFRIFRALISNYSKKIDNLEIKLINDNKERLEKEVGIIRDNFKKYFVEIKQKYESEIKELRLQVSGICENSDKTLETIFKTYENQFEGMEKRQLDEIKNRSKAFNEFMDELVSKRDSLIERFDKSFNKIQADWGSIQQIKTNNVYLNAYHKNTARSKNSENKFIGVTALSLFLSVLTIIAFIFRAIDFSQFISIKIMIVVFFGILIAYYLRISTHYRRLADQAEQTHLELLAFPQYAADLGVEKSREIKEQLALKYFGKEIDASGYQKISDIAQEQLKTSSELVKAAASLSVASTKTSGGAQNNENNEAQNTSSPSEKSR